VLNAKGKEPANITGGSRVVFCLSSIRGSPAAANSLGPMADICSSIFGNYRSGVRAFELLTKRTRVQSRKRILGIARETLLVNAPPGDRPLR